MDDAEFFKIMLAGFAVLCFTVLRGFQLWFRHRESLGGGRTELEALRAENAQLRADVDAQFAELEDRMEFTERRLIQERSVSRAELPTRIPTPV